MPLQPAALQPQAAAVHGRIHQTVVILGARGRLGYCCVQAFAQAGWHVLAHVRANSVMHHQEVPDSQVRWIATDLEDAKTWQTLAHQAGGIDVVVNAMAPKFSVTVWAKELVALTQQGTRLAQQLQALLIHPLSVLACGTQIPEIWRENNALPSVPDNRLGKLRWATEVQLAQAAAEGVSVCTLRTGTFYGHHGWGWISSAVAKDVRKGIVHGLGPYNVVTPWAYVPDVAETMVRIAEHKQRLIGWTQLHFAGHAVTGEDWAQALEAVCQTKGWIGPEDTVLRDRVHWWMWKPAAWFSTVVRALSEMEYVWRTPHRLDNTQLKALIGPEPHTPWRTSVAQTVDLLERREDLHGGLTRTHQAY